MFGLNKKKRAKIDELEIRLSALAKKVEENNHDVAELKSGARKSQVAFKALADKVVELRQALSDAIKSHE